MCASTRAASRFLIDVGVAEENVAVLTWSGVTARRMARHGLVEPATGLTDVVGVVCGVHAQVMSAAELSAGRRVAGATRAEVWRALWEERSLVKTFGPRGTVHLLPTAELPMWTGALSALPSSVPTHPEPVRFTAEQADEIIAAIGAVLAEAELTVDELTEAIGDRVGAWAVERTMDAFQDKWPRWRQLTSTAAHRGVLCFGPNRGRNVTYTNPHRWLPGFRAEDGDAALRRLVKRYLYAYGPATQQHFAKWLSISPRHAAALFGELAGELECVELDGEPGWVIAGDVEVPARPHRGSGCCRTSTRSLSRGSLGSGCIRVRPRPAHSARRVRPATIRCCSSTVWSAGCGTSGGPAAGSPSRSSRCVTSPPRSAAGSTMRSTW